MLRQGGKLVLYKTASSHSEVDSVRQRHSEILGGELVAEHSYRLLTGDRQDRVLCYVAERVKVVLPAKYPRPAGEPFSRNGWRRDWRWLTRTKIRPVVSDSHATNPSLYT